MKDQTHLEQLTELASTVRGLAELDRLLGIPCSPVPTLAPLRSPPAPATSAPAPSTPAPSAPATSAPAGGPVSDLEARAAANGAKLNALAQEMTGCTKCALSQGRTNLVFGQGHAAAELVFVGEGPGQHEDESGLAFVGKAGELLTKMIQAMGLRREDVFICNVVKCRPPSNRAPQADEMGTCLPFLQRQLEIIRPKVICSMGKTAAVGLGLIGPGDGLGRNRGFKEWQGIPTMVTYHPAYLLRQPGEKRKVWQDLQALFPYLERRQPVR